MKSSSMFPFLSTLKHVHFLHPVARFLFQRNVAGLEKPLMGLTFTHPVGIAAGIDRRGEFTDALSCFSPAFIEIGPLRDIRFAIKNLQNRSSSTIVLGNLSNSTDLVRSFTLIYDFVDAIVLDVSMNSSISKVIDHLLELRRCNDTYKPILFKLFPDLTTGQMENVVQYMLGSGIDGVMAGAEFVSWLRDNTHGLLPIIVTAEIPTPEHVAQLLDSGADLIAVADSPFHYGPRLIYKIVKYLEKR